MSESQQQESTPETTPNPSSTPAPTSEWRAGPGSPFAGKTADEILGIATGQAYALEQANQMLGKFNQPPAEPPRSRFDLDIADDQYIEGRQLKQIVHSLVNQSPQDPVARNLAASALYTNIRTQFSEDFKKWGSEIDAEIRKLPVDYWTYDALNTIVKMVRANHLDEIAAEKAQRLLQEQHPTIRSGSGGSGSGPQYNNTRTLDSDTLPQGWVTQARARGIDEATVREFCEMTGQTPEQYLAEVEKYGKNAGVIRG